MTIKQYIDIQEVLEEELDILDKIIMILHYLGIRDIDDEYWDNITPKEYSNIINEHKWLFKQPKPLVNDYDISTITFGQYIDMFKYYNDDEKFISLFGLTIDDDIRELITYKQKFKEYYNKLVENYPVIYGNNDEIEEEIVVEEIENRRERYEQMQLINKEKLRQEFSWISIIYMLSDGDITKFDKIVETSNNLVHTYLAYMIMKEKEMI